jgi:hypothetical protein
MAKIEIVTSFSKFKVQVLTSESQADLLVYLTQSESEAKGKDEIWYMTEHFSDLKISYVTSFPDLKVCFVKSKSAACWKNKTHKLQGQIG